jgi:hypothetical protein
VDYTDSTELIDSAVHIEFSPWRYERFANPAADGVQIATMQPCWVYEARAIPGGSYRGYLEIVIPRDRCPGWRGTLQSNTFELIVQDEIFEAESAVFRYPTLARVSQAGVVRWDVQGTDSIVFEMRKGFKLHAEVGRQVGAGRMFASGLPDLTRQIYVRKQRTEEIHKMGSLVDSCSIRIFESSLGMGYHAKVYGYGKRMLLQHEWTVKLIADTVSNDSALLDLFDR